MAMNGKRMSYFEERRNKNPNFFNSNNIDNLKDITKNVRRIITDIINDQISPEDYIFFSNRNIINICMQESYKQYNLAFSLKNAIDYYFNTGLKNGIPPYPGIDINNEIAACSNNLVKYNNRYVVWKTVYDMFSAINSGADPQFISQYMKMYVDIRWLTD